MPIAPAKFNLLAAPVGIRIEHWAYGNSGLPFLKGEVDGSSPNHVIETQGL